MKQKNKLAKSTFKAHDYFFASLFQSPSLHHFLERMSKILLLEQIINKCFVGRGSVDL